MEQGGLTKDELQHLFENLEVLRRLSEECFASDVRDSHIIHHHSDVQTGETTPSRVRQQTFLHGATSVAQTTHSNDRRQTSTVAASDEASHVQSTVSRGGTRAAPTPIAHETVRVDLMAKSFEHHDVVPLSFHSSPTIDRIQPLDGVSTDSLNRHSNDRFIASATNGCRTTRVSKR